MVYKYDVNNYGTRIKALVLFGGTPAVLLILKGYRPQGIALGLLVVLASVFLIFAYYYNDKFSFTVKSNALSVRCGKTVADIPWSDIADINETNRGLAVRLDDEQHFTLLNDMRNYRQFKAQIIEKALEYRIPIKLITK